MQEKKAEERKKQREALEAKKLARGKLPPGAKSTFMITPEQEEGCIIDNLLNDIKKVKLLHTYK